MTVLVRAKARCARCHAPTIGHLCAACRITEMQKPLDCAACGRPTWTRNTPESARAAGSVRRGSNTNGRVLCQSHYLRALKTGEIKAAQRELHNKKPPTPAVFAGVATLTEDELGQALCSQADPDAWFPEKGMPTAPAKRVCFQCPIRERCLDVALTNGEDHGIFGGLSVNERRKLRQDAATTETEAAA